MLDARRLLPVLVESGCGLLPPLVDCLEPALGIVHPIFTGGDCSLGFRRGILRFLVTPGGLIRSVRDVRSSVCFHTLVRDRNMPRGCRSGWTFCCLIEIYCTFCFTHWLLHIWNHSASRVVNSPARFLDRVGEQKLFYFMWLKRPLSGFPPFEPSIWSAAQGIWICVCVWGWTS